MKNRFHLIVLYSYAINVLLEFQPIARFYIHSFIHFGILQDAHRWDAIDKTDQENWTKRLSKVEAFILQANLSRFKVLFFFFFDIRNFWWNNQNSGRGFKKVTRIVQLKESSHFLSLSDVLQKYWIPFQIFKFIIYFESRQQAEVQENKISIVCSNWIAHSVWWPSHK